MNKSVLIGAAWCASLVLAWFLGSNAAEAPSYRADRDSEMRAAAATTDSSSETGAAMHSSSARTRGTATGPAGRTGERDDAADAAANEAEADTPFSLEGVDSIEELSRRFMAYADRKLKQGPEGRLELYRTFDGLTQNRELRPLFRNEYGLAPLAYPWMKFLMDRTPHIGAMMEDVYKKAATDPAWFEGTDDDTLEIFTEGLAVLLPGFADEAMMERMTGYVVQILERDKESVPKSVQRNLRDFQKNLEMWGGPLAPEEALQQLRDPNLSSAAAMELLRRLDRKSLDGVDVQPYIVRALEGGNSRAVQVLGKLGAGAGDQRAFDAAFMQGLESGGMNQWNIRTYLDATKRGSWADARFFMEDGLGRGGKTTEKFALALGWMPEPPPKEYIQGVLQNYALSEKTQQYLRRRFPTK